MTRKPETRSTRSAVVNNTARGTRAINLGAIHMRGGIRL